MEAFFNDFFSAVTVEDSLRAKVQALEKELRLKDEKLVTLVHKESELQTKYDRLRDEKFDAIKHIDLVERESTYYQGTIDQEEMKITRLEDEAFASLMKIDCLENELIKQQGIISSLESTKASLTRELENERNETSYHKELAQEKEMELQASLKREDLYRARCDELGEVADDLHACLDRVIETNHDADQNLKVDAEAIDLVWDLAREADEKIEELEEKLEKSTSEIVHLKKVTDLLNKRLTVQNESVQVRNAITADRIRQLEKKLGESEEKNMLMGMEKDEEQEQYNARVREVEKKLYDTETKLNIVTEGYEVVKTENYKLKKKLQTMSTASPSSGYLGDCFVGFSTFF